MLGGGYPGGGYPAQGYPVTGATVPPAETYGIDILGTDGSLIARLGNISGLPWGGSGFVLPLNTYGLWGTRAGVWIKGMPQMFYANASELSTNIFGAGGPSGKWEFDVDELMPFSSIEIPNGRMVTWEDFLYFYTVTLVSAPGVTSPTVVSFTVSPPLFIATKDGGLLREWNYMTGPASGSGTAIYNNIVLRRRYQIQTSGTGGAGATWTFTVRRIAVLRMLAHDVHQGPTLQSSFKQFTSAATVSQGTRDGADKDPAGGTGTEANTGGGGVPGNAKLM